MTLTVPPDVTYVCAIFTSVAEAEIAPVGIVAVPFTDTKTSAPFDTPILTIYLGESVGAVTLCATFAANNPVYITLDCGSV